MTIRFVQIGIGVRGTTWARIIREDPRAEVVGYVDLRTDIARQKADSWGQESVPCFSDLKEALEAVEADAVLIVTPPEVHLEQATMAFEHGCHVLCEKPLAEELPEAIEITRQAEAHGLQLMVGMNERHLPATQAVRRLIMERRFGVPGFGHFVYLRHRNRPELSQYPFAMKQPMLHEQSIHHLDRMRYCYDAEVEAVAVATWRPSWSPYADDSCVSALLSFEGGLQVNYMGTWTAGWSGFQFEWRTDFPRGVFIQRAQFGDISTAEFIPDLATTGPVFKTAEDAEPLQPVPLPEIEDFVDDTRGLLDEFVIALEEGQPLETSGQDHIKTLSLVSACVEAAETRQWVEMRDFSLRQGIPESWL